VPAGYVMLRRKI